MPPVEVVTMQQLTGLAGQYVSDLGGTELQSIAVLEEK